MDLAVHLLTLLRVDELTLADGSGCDLVGVLSVGAEARLLLEVTVRTVITLVILRDDVLGVQALVALMTVHIGEGVAVVVVGGRRLTVGLLH